jgi:hypothetical protein
MISRPSENSRDNRGDKDYINYKMKPTLERPCEK